MGDLTHDKVMWKRTVKQGFRTRGPPQTCSSIYPKTRICLSYYFVPFTNSPDIQGAIPDHLSLEKINLGFQLISLLDMREYFKSNPLCQHSSLLARFIQTLAAMHVIVHSLPPVRGMGSLKHRAFQRVKSYLSSAGVGFHYWASACC